MQDVQDRVGGCGHCWRYHGIQIGTSVGAAGVGIKACDASLILQAVHENCEAHKAGIKALQVHIDASADVTGLQLTQIQEHLKRLKNVHE